MSNFNNKLIIPFSRNFSSYSNRSFFRRNNYNNRNYSDIPIYKYIDVKIDSKFEEIKGLLNDMKNDNENFQNNVRKDFKNFEEKIDTKFQNFEEKIDTRFKNFEGKIDTRFLNFEEKINSKMMTKAIAAGSAAFVIFGGFVSFLGSTGVKFDPPKMYLEEKNKNK